MSMGCGLCGEKDLRLGFRILQVSARIYRAVFYKGREIEEMWFKMRGRESAMGKDCQK